MNPSDLATSCSSGAQPDWEIESRDGEWSRFDALQSRTLDEAFGKKDSVRIGDGIIRFKRMVSEHLSSGEDRRIRRRLIKCDPTCIVTSRQFDGRCVYMTTVNNEESENLRTVSFSDLVGDASGVDCAFLTSFGTDLEWVLGHFHRGTPITIVDQASDESLHASSIRPYGDRWPNLEVVYPHMQKERGSFMSGSMHCKLLMFRYKNSDGLRIVVSSANLIRFDWEEIRQCAWVLDVNPNGTPGGTSPTTLGSDLKDFVFHLLKHVETHTDWREILKIFENDINEQCPLGVSLVASVPGTHSQLWKFGHMRLRDLLAKSKVSAVSSVAFQMSSIGKVQPALTAQFAHSIGYRGNSENLRKFLRLVWPEYSACMFTSGAGKEHMFLSPKNEATCHQFLTPLRPPLVDQHKESRKNLLNHSKFMIGWEGATDKSPMWIYMGSHNMSMAAWGRLVYEGRALQIANYELGLFIEVNNEVIEFKEFKINVPFDTSQVYAPMCDKPWMMEAFFSRALCGTDALSDEDKMGISCLGLTRSMQVLSLKDFVGCSNDSDKPLVVAIVSEEEAALNARCRDQYLSTLKPQFIAKRVPVFEIDLRKVSKTAHPSDSYVEHLLALLGVGGTGNDPPKMTVVLLEPNEKSEIVVDSIFLDEELFNFDLKGIYGEDPLEVELPESIPAAEQSLQFLKENEVALLCLDVDGTIVASNTSVDILPSAAKFLRRLHADVPELKVALVTNQGAVGLRHWMETARFGNPAELPSQQEVLARLETIFKKVQELFHGELTMYTAFRYQSKQGRWCPVPADQKEDPRWNQEWRKPNPGMIREAMKWAGVGISGYSALCSKRSTNVAMVGDMDSDEGAANNAKILFKKAPEFFN